MRAIDRYIVRSAFGAFLLVVLSLTGIAWITHALRAIDLITNQNQTILVFLGITGLLIPALLLVVAPLSLVIAVFYVLNKLNADCELPVMNAAGMSPGRVFRPFLMFGATVALIVAIISAYLAPMGIRGLRDAMLRVRADVVTNIVQPGRFFQIEPGLTFHIRERSPDGELIDVFLDDRRNPDLRLTLLAQRGEIVQDERGTFLLLDNGSIQRQETGQPNPAIVVFERYAFDLSPFMGDRGTSHVPGPSERSIWELATIGPSDAGYQKRPAQFRTELHDRLLAPIYPFAFVVIAFLVLGAPRSTRRSQAEALGLAIAAVATLRFAGFAAIAGASKFPELIVVLYILVFGVIGCGSYLIYRGVLIEPPAFLSNITEAGVALIDRISVLTRRTARS